VRSDRERLRDILQAIEQIEVDLNIAWLVVERDLSSLKGKIEAILQELGET
jgi:uncharacterized protein with HEPN domain